MSIATPVERYAQSKLAQAASTTFSPASTLAAGTRGVLLLASASSKVASAVTDSVGNTWQVNVVANPGTLGCSYASCQVATQVTSSDTITITWSASNSTSAQIWLEEVSGLASSAAFDKTHASSLSGTVFTAGSTGTLTNANEVVFAMFKATQTGTSFTPDAGWTATTTPLLQGSAGVIYQIVSSTTSVTPRGTWNGATGAYEMLAATYSDTSIAPPSAPTNSVAPVASGTGTVGLTLSTTDGTWTGSPTFSYQWQRDNSGGGSYTDITGETSNAHTNVVLDGGCQVRCTVTGTNAGGSASAASNAISVATPPAAPAIEPYALIGVM